MNENLIKALNLLNYQRSSASMPRFQPASIAAFIWPARDCVAEKENPAGRRFLLKSYFMRKRMPLESDDR